MQKKETSIYNADQFSQYHNLTIPINNLTEFIKFNERLKDDEKLCTDVVSKIKIFINFKL